MERSLGFTNRKFKLCFKSRIKKIFYKNLLKWLLGKIHMIKKIINRYSITLAHEKCIFCGSDREEIARTEKQLCFLSSNIQLVQFVNLVQLIMQIQKFEEIQTSIDVGPGHALETSTH